MEEDKKFVNVDRELQELMAVYVAAEKQMRIIEEMHLITTRDHMRRYIEGYDDRIKLCDKIQSLKDKMNCEEGSDECCGEK